MDKLQQSQLLDGMVVDRSWLKGKGISVPLVDYYLRTGHLERVAYGAYRKPGDRLKWEHLVYSLQMLGYNVHVGGQSALELLGLAHYLPFGPKQKIHLFCDIRLPRWFFKTDVPVEFIEHRTGLFGNAGQERGLTTVLFGSWDWKINVASREMALMEMMLDLPRRTSFHMVDVIMESAATLRPEVVGELLRECKNIKVKRLFLWFAEKYGHQWFELVKLDKVDLGKGKRVVQKAGKLDSKYLITVPKDDHDKQEQPVF
ncbi:MAG: type IV toxin-antitoxin system AbiEi family antitoxin domain-containing protein [Candidatus Omnitrophota bacterium]